MRVMPYTHWLAHLNTVAGCGVFVVFNAAILTGAVIPVPVEDVLSWTFAGVTILATLFSGIAAVQAWRLGYVVVSFIYCLCTHDPTTHWLCRWVATARPRVQPPAWLREIGF